MFTLRWLIRSKAFQLARSRIAVDFTMLAVVLRRRRDSCLALIADLEHGLPARSRLSTGALLRGGLADLLRGRAADAVVSELAKHLEVQRVHGAAQPGDPVPGTRYLD